MRRYLTNFLALPDNEYTHTVSNLWTVNAQVLTAALWLLFELIFAKNEDGQIFDTQQIQDLALKSLQFLQVNQDKSSIAKRGVGLIVSLLDTNKAIKEGSRQQFSLEEIISRVEASEKEQGQNISKESPSDPLSSQMADFLLGDHLAWEDILNAFDM